MPENFDRQYRFMAGQAGSAGFEVGAPSGPQNMPLHVNFSIERTEDPDSQNKGTVKLWNLSKQHIDALNEPDCVIALYAGYGNTRPLIMAGVVSTVVTELDGADISTEIEIVDTRVEIRDTYVSLSYADSINAKVVIQDVADQMGVDVIYSYNAEFVDIPNGYSYVGPAKDALTKMCDCCGLIWNIQFGVLHVKKPYDTLLREVYVLSSATGLIGIPKRTTESKTDDASKRDSGWEVEFLMNAAINVDDFVRLESKYVTGYFRVAAIKVEGDNFGGTWSCVAKLFEAE